jgi:DNA-binding GntR family transcriptional regulator
MSNSAEAYRRILKAIVTSEIKPGETVTELQLSGQFGFGRTPVREAIMRLEHEGFIVSSERKKKIYILFPKDIEDVFSLKQAIECMISRKAAETTSLQHKSALKEFLSEVNGLSRNVQDEQFIQKWLDMDNRFHNLLFLMADNQRAGQIVDKLNLQFKRIKVGMMVLEGRVDKAIQEHVGIGNAVVSGDGEAASLLMYEHLEDVKRTIINLMNIFYS